MKFKPHIPFISKSNQSIKAGLPPGRLVYVGPEKNQLVTIKVFDYDENSFQEKEMKTADECASFKNSLTASWINVDGIHDAGIVQSLGDVFQIHPLALEDIMNTNQRPKIDEGKTYDFIVLKMIEFNEATKTIEVEQVSLVLGANYVISFQEDAQDLFNSVRDRLRSGNSRIRRLPSDYLMYALMDKIVDNYFTIIEKLGERLDAIEDAIDENPTANVLQEIKNLKRETLQLKKSIWPLREVINAILRGETAFVKTEQLPYFRDLYDHTIQVIDTIETYRDLLSGILDIYMSTVSVKMNQVMKVLTIISTIFIPLTFIVGVYGMNFKNMPELEWHYGYFEVIGLMLAVSLGLIYYFRRKGWF